MTKQMDGAWLGLLGVIIGAVASALGNFVTQWFSARKEKKQWERQQEGEEKKRLLKEDKEDKARMREVYQNSLRCLSLIESDIWRGAEAKKEHQEEWTKLISETKAWLSRLLLHVQMRDIAAARKIRDGIDSLPHNASLTRDFLLEHVKYDDILSDGVLAIEAPAQSDDVREFHFWIHQDYRREQFVRGIDIPDRYTFNYDIFKLPETTRSRLVEAFWKGGFPRRLDLQIKATNGNLTAWYGRLNPSSIPPEEIFDAWLKAYDESLLLIEESAPSS